MLKLNRCQHTCDSSPREDHFLQEPQSINKLTLTVGVSLSHDVITIKKGIYCKLQAHKIELNC